MIFLDPRPGCSSGQAGSKAARSELIATFSGQDSVASSLRLIQVFTDVWSYPGGRGQSLVNKIYKYLISQGYYEKVRALADSR